MNRPAVVQTALAVILFAMIVLIAIKVISSISTKPFSSSALANPNATDIATLLDKIGPDGNLKIGAVLDVAEIGKNDGSKLLLVVAEGTFKSSTIEPQKIWSNLLDTSTLIVSSGDEFLRNDGGISRAIGYGCSIQQVHQPIPTGTTVIIPCNGNYKRAFPNIRYVGNAIVVAWKGVDETPNCKTDSDTTVGASETAYAKCIKNAIESSLSDLFSKHEMTSIDTVVLPALGTGTGKVPKGIFYQAVANALEKCLTSTKGCDRMLPRRIIFLVWAQESGWTDTRNAIARNLARLGDDWRPHYAPDSSISKQARYLGVLSVLLAFVMLVLCRKMLPTTVAAHLPAFNGISLWFVVFGWGIVAAGAFSILSDVLDVFASPGSPNSGQNLLVNIAFGVIAAASCGLIHRATKAFQQE